MAKRGPRGDTQEIRQAKGTRGVQPVVTLFEDHASLPDPEIIDPPKWLNAAAKRIWKTKTERYRQRGQKIDGFQDVLAQYCSLEAELIDRRRRKVDVPTSMLNCFKDFSSLFYDNPASQKVVVGKTDKKGNGFNGLGKR